MIVEIQQNEPKEDHKIQNIRNDFDKIENEREIKKEIINNNNNIINNDTQIIIVENKHYENHVYPSIPLFFAWTILIVNLFLPGVGTLLTSFFTNKHYFYFMCVGIYQLITACLIIGWIWALITSLILINKAK